MNGINDAFDRLRDVVPNVISEQKLSKIETLLVAQTYIMGLAKLIESVMKEELDFNANDVKRVTNCCAI